MRRVKMIINMLLSAFAAVTLQAQNPDLVLQFIGTDALEEMNPYDVERLEDLLEHPLELNYASEAKLRETGLLTRYQIASLADYRKRHGDILSYSELAAVDGFGRAFTARLAPFVSLESRRLPGSAPTPGLSNDISVRMSARKDSYPTYGLKYRLAAGERITAGLSMSRTSDAGSGRPDVCSGFIALHFRRITGKILVGDFNARFGQGLSLWNGMSISGLTSASSFMRSPSFISSSSSFTGTYAMRGVAGDIRMGRLSISWLTAVSKTEGKFSAMPAVNVSRMFRTGQVSLTHYADFSLTENALQDMKTSADFAFCIKGTDIFAETSYDWASSSLAVLGGVSAAAGEDVRLAVMLRCFPSSYNPSRSAAARSTTECTNEYAASLAADFSSGRWIEVNGASGFGSSVRRHSGNVSADLAYFPISKDGSMSGSIQLKARAEWSVMLSHALKASMRLSERIRTWGDPFRTEARADLSYFSRQMFINLRMNAVQCSSVGVLTYMEGGYKAERISFWLRQGLFLIDRWEDRIYAYERDAPGSFNVPAYYGRGVWTALTMSWRFARWGRMYLRGAVTSYPFMAEKKPGRAELKSMCVFTF